MTPLDIARIRRSDDPTTFLHAYTRATQADAWGLGTELLILDAIRRDAPAEAAGLLEGLASLHAAAGMPLKAAPLLRKFPNLRQYAGTARPNRRNTTGGTA